MESLSRISGVLETTRDLTLDAARDARKPTPATGSSVASLKRLLESRNEREILEGLRRVVAQSKLPTASADPPLLFSAVVKNVASNSLAIKRLVYIYLIQYAESEPDTALLAINTIQKSLSAPEPNARALALRIMSSLRMPVISQIVALGIKKGAGDMSPIVRRTAALAIPKCWRLDHNTTPALLESLTQLLGDRQCHVSGAAVIAFMDVCSDRIDLIHKHYRSLVRRIVDMDDWAQLATLKLMLLYSRQCFPLRTRKIRKGQANNSTNFYGDEQNDEIDGHENAGHEEQQILDPDLTLLLDSAQPLLFSRNSSVVVSVARLYLYLTQAKSTYLKSAVGPLVALLRTPTANAELALHSIIQVALIIPAAFVEYVAHFLIRVTDTPQIRASKLELLTITFPHANAHAQSLILTELSHFAASGSDTLLVREAVRALGRCAQSTPPGSRTANRCLRLLLEQITSPDADLVAESLTVVRHLIQADPSAHIGTVTRLARFLDTITAPAARASTIWLIGEFAGLESQNGGGNIAADVLRILVKGFADESVEAKLQIVTLAAKVQLHSLNRSNAEKQSNESDATNGPTKDESEAAAEVDVLKEEPVTTKMWSHILLLSRYDTSYDLRDRARLYRALLSSPTSTQLASLLLLAPKPVPTAPSPSEGRRGFTLGSASAVLGSDLAGSGGIHGYTPVPDWVEAGREPEASLREGDVNDRSTGDVGKTLGTASERLDAMARDDKSHGLGLGGAAGSKVAEKSLDDWLDETDGSESEEEETEEGEETDEESDEEEGSEEEEESDDEDEANEAARLVA